jgi:hypothetical protein
MGTESWEAEPVRARIPSAAHPRRRRFRRASYLTSRSCSFERFVEVTAQNARARARKSCRRWRIQCPRGDRA